MRTGNHEAGTRVAAQDAADPTRRWMSSQLAALRRDRMFMVLLCALTLFSAFAPGKIASYPRLVDWSTIAALTGLLLLTKAVEMSGVLYRIAHWLLDRMVSKRTIALALVSLTSVLSMLLTNDVALFAVVPLTLGICKLAQIPSTRLIVFEALAVNAASALTPIGNPQNLFLWQQSGVAFWQFVLQMLPLVVPMLAFLFALTWFAFPADAVHRETEPLQAMPIDRRLLGMALIVYVPFLVIADLHRAGWALAAVVAVFSVFRRRVLAAIDWGLLIVFVLMFIDLRLLASMDFVRAWMPALGLEQAAHAYWTAIAASQLISNVPAAIAVVEYSHHWRAIAFGVNVGGFGVLIGSLANLIALRMAPEPGKYLAFHAWSVPFLIVAALIGYALLHA
ncbi:MAG: SLC13 family permease [Dokdonella sp.]